MTLAQIAAQVFGAVGILVFILLYQFNNMKSVLKAKMCMDVLWAAHYLLLGAYSGFATNMICLGRELVFFNNDKKPFNSKAWLWIFIAFNLISAILTRKGYYSVFPALAASLATVSFHQKSITVARIIGITNNILMFTYDIFVGSYMGLVGETLAFISVVIAIFRNARKSKNAA
ncbi:MAG: YgjV family protein [Eubacteriales bacterium]|nr:YgjV family protein [Eubacteriales bacterium]